VKILWISNIILPEVSEMINEPIVPFGGWLVNSSKYLSNTKSVDLLIASPKHNIKKIIELKGNKISYFLFPSEISLSKDKSLVIKMLEKISPDIVHIYGTEFTHSLFFTEICSELSIKSVVSIQGLISICALHYYSNLPFKIIRSLTFRDLIKRENITTQKKEFEKRGNIEIKCIKKTQNVIGRTTFDRAVASQINLNARYFSCNETLRDSFYNHVWDITKIDKYSIFLSQGNYPIKGRGNQSRKCFIIHPLLHRNRKQSLWHLLE
jgi:hypothetical protein